MTDKPSIAQALAAVMEDVRAVGKGDRNTQQNYNFRGIDAVVNAAGPALRKHGVVVMPMVEAINYRDVQTSTGKASRECTVTVRYRFHGPAGDYLDCVTPGESMDFGDKGAPKAMSVAFRIALLQALCLPTTDTDPDAQQYERGSAPSQQERSAPPQQRSNGQRQRPGANMPTVPARGDVVPESDPQDEPPSEWQPSDATEARKWLNATLQEHQWDPTIVANRYKAATGVALGAETDTAKIVGFRESLFAVSDDELRKQPAANGAGR